MKNNNNFIEANNNNTFNGNYYDPPQLSGYSYLPPHPHTNIPNYQESERFNDKIVDIIRKGKYKNDLEIAIAHSDITMFIRKVLENHIIHFKSKSILYVQNDINSYTDLQQFLNFIDITGSIESLEIKFNEKYSYITFQYLSGSNSIIWTGDLDEYEIVTILNQIK